MSSPTRQKRNGGNGGQPVHVVNTNKIKCPRKEREDKSIWEDKGDEIINQNDGNRKINL